MELRIMTQMGPGVLPEIEWNNEELKQEIARKAEEYKSIAYTDGQAAEMKKDRATLNKLVTAFEDQRKQVKKFYQAPYDKFEGQVKEVLAPVREAIKVIDTGLSEIERQYRVDKTNKMREFYDTYVGDLKGIIPFERTIKEENYRKSITDKKLEQGYIDFFQRVREEMESLDSLPERFRDKALMKYTEAYSISDALREGKRLEEMEKMMEERRKEQEEEKREAAAREAERQAALRSQAPAESAPEPQKPEAEKPASEAPENPVLCLDFRAWGTREQLMGLRQYMIDNGIRFGKVE